MRRNGKLPYSHMCKTVSHMLALTNKRGASEFEAVFSVIFQVQVSCN